MKQKLAELKWEMGTLIIIFEDFNMIIDMQHVHVPNNRTLKQMKQKLAELKWEMGTLIIIFEDFNMINDRANRKSAGIHCTLKTLVLN